MSHTVFQKWMHYEPLVLTTDEYNRLCVEYPQHKLFLRAIKIPTLHPIKRNCWAYQTVARWRGEGWDESKNWDL